MNKVLTIVTYGLVLCSCGGNGKNECDRAADKVASMTNDACQGRDDCCFCKCWNDGHQLVDDPVQCTCKNQNRDETCTGDALTFAQMCLSDEDWCNVFSQSAVEFECRDGSTPCDELDGYTDQAQDEVCSGKDNQCCYCRCWNDGHKIYDTDKYYADQTCECMEPGSTGEDRCDDFDGWLSAEQCLAVESCWSMMSEAGKNMAETFCQGTPIP